LCLFFLFFSHTALSAPIITIDDRFNQLSINEHSDVLVNPHNESLEALNAKGHFNTFILSNKKRIHEASSHSESLVFRLGLKNESHKTQNLWLNIKNKNIQSFDAYRHTKAGFIPLPNASNNSLNASSLIKELALAPSEIPSIIYITVKLKEQKSPELELVNPHLYVIRDLSQQTAFIITASVLLALGFLNLFLAIYRSNLVFLYNSCLILASICIHTAATNLPLLWFSNFNEWQVHSMAALFFVSTSSTLLCIMQYVQNQKNAAQQRIYHPIYRWLMISLYLNTFINISMIFFIEEFFAIILVPIALIAIILPVTFLYSFFKHNDRIALAFLISCSATIVGILYFIATDTPTAFSLDMFSLPCVLYLFTANSFVVSALLFINDEKHLISSIHHQHTESTAQIARESQSALLKKISGEIQSPLSDISGASDLLLNSSPLNFEQEKHCSIIHNSILLLVNKIVDIDYDIKLLEDTSPIRTSPFELIPRLERWIKKMTPDAQQRNIELIMDINNDVPYTVKGDEYRLRQIITHLMTSAILRTAQGQISFSVWKSESDNKIVFSIHDTGQAPDIDASYNSSVSGNNSEQSREALAIELLKSLNSHLEITAQPNNNTLEFRLSLPSLEKFSNTPTLIDNLKNKRLLIVDDNKTSLEILKRQTARWGMKSTEADDAQKAISFYRNSLNLNTPFDALIIDYDMPKMTGLELAHKINQEAGEHKPHIIMLTGTNQSPSERLARAAGIDLIIDKPVSQELLRTMLSNIFNEKAQLINHAIPAKKINVLVVDDDDTMRFVISKMLDSFAMEHTLVSSGEKAYEACLKQNFDIILMDCQMPGMDGFETAIAIHNFQKNHGKALTPVIALTAYTLSEYKQKSKEAGMTSYLEKPIAKNELLAALQKHQPW